MLIFALLSIAYALTTDCNTTDCGANGVCISGWPYAFCACFGNWAGAACDACDVNFTGDDCLDSLCVIDNWCGIHGT
jgi:hypothetical protein